MIKENDLSLMKEIEKIVRAREHRVRNPKSNKHQEFLKDQIEKIENLKMNHPKLNLVEDEAYFKDQII